MLSQHFSMEEFTASKTAVRNGIDNTLPPSLRGDAWWFFATIMEPIRIAIGRPITLTSGYRCPELNALVGGSEHSYHQRGTAADFIVPGLSAQEVARTVHSLDLPFDKLILEFDRWVHIQGRPPGRKRVLTAIRVDGRTEYQAGIT